MENLPAPTNPTALAPGPATQLPNRYITAFRGHGRQWPDEAIGTLLHALAQGQSLVKACAAAGIYRPSFYQTMDRDPDLAEAVRHIQARDGSDALEELVHAGTRGEISHRVAQYVRMALELRGKLGPRAQASASATVVVHIERPTAYNGVPLTTIEGKARAPEPSAEEQESSP